MQEQLAHVVLAAHAAAHRERDEELVGGAGDDIEQDPALVGRGGDVQEDDLVGARPVVGGRQLRRVAGVPEVDEPDALDDAPGRHVQAGDDALGGHRRPRYPAPQTARKLA